VEPHCEDGSIYWKIDSFFVSQRDKEFYKITGGGGPPYPLPVGAYPYLADLNSDGVCDIIGVKLHSDSTWHLCGIDAKNKNILWENDYSFFGVSIGDLDNDGINEIVTSFIKRYYGINKDSIFLRCFEGNTGNLKWEYKTKDPFFNEYEPNYSYQPAIADINKDNYKEIVFVIDNNWTLYYIFLNILDKNGNLLHKDSIEGSIFNWNYYECGESYYAPVIVDIDNDDTIEVSYWAMDVLKWINGVNFQQEEWEPFVLHGLGITAQFADVDDDTTLEIVFLVDQLDTQMPGPRGAIYVYNECVNKKETKILLKKINKNFIYNVSGQKFIKENLRNLPPGIYLSPYEKKKYFKILKGR